jgi:hypothetical protein
MQSNSSIVLGPALNKLVPTLVLFAVLMVVATPQVKAQTASITNLQSPSHSLFGKAVQAVAYVNYTTGSKGAFLIAYVIDTGTHKYVTGSAASSQNKCMLNTDQYSNAAFCRYAPRSSSGTDTITFTLQFSEKKEYSLAAWVGFQDTYSNVLSDSLYRWPFPIAISDKLTLEVQAPYPVVVTVDGVPQTPGQATLYELALGQHTISVPSAQPVDQFSRLRFDHWSDGSKDTSRTVNLQDDTALSVLYATQYRLDLASLQAKTNGVGAGWYDSGSTATFSSASTQPMDGMLGTLGGKWVFQGWYEGNNLMTSSASGSVKMDRAHALMSQWAPDYTQPLIILGVIVIVVVVAIGLAGYRMRKRGHEAPD